MVGVTIVTKVTASSVGVIMVGTNQSHLPLQHHCIITFFPSNVAVILEELEDAKLL